jgi:ribonuclease BN (tRNA processing enzyme)
MIRHVLIVVFTLALSATARAQTCGDAPLQVQVLVSGGPALIDGRAAASLLIWIDGKPRLLIDAGPGTARRFAQTGAGVADLDAVLFTHLRVERTGDLPALLQLAAAPRDRPLPIYGPPGSRAMPSTVSFVRSLFDPTRGSWRHLRGLLSPLARAPYKLEPHDLRAHPPALAVPREKREELLPVFKNKRLEVTAVFTPLAQTPALAWRIDGHGKRIVVASHGGSDATERLARGADLLALPLISMEDADMLDPLRESTPTALGRLAHKASVQQLLLAPRAHATLGREADATTLVRQHYPGTLVLANDMECVTP